MGLRVLITNNTAAGRAGTEMYVRDLATALLDRGHTPIVFSTHLGEVAQELRSATVPVIDRLDALADPPDIIHGHHHVDTLTALLHFTQTPGVFVCHGWLPWEETPPRFSRIRRYLAVDETCRDRLTCEHGIPQTDVEVLLNFVDLYRFRPRAPLPAKPQRALIFSNAAGEANYVTTAREACARHGLTLDVRGMTSGQPATEPEEILRDYDVVFAKARAALEAMAVGAAVVLCDAVGAGPLVSTANFETLRPLNFGIRTIRQTATADYLAGEIAKYDAHDAQAVSTRVRETAGRDSVVDRFVEIYQQVIAEHQLQPAADREREEREISAYLHWLAPRGMDLARLHNRISDLTSERHALQQQCVQLQHDAIQFRRGSEEQSTQLAALMKTRQQVSDQLAVSRSMRDDALRELQTLQQTVADNRHLDDQLAVCTTERDALLRRLQMIQQSAFWKLHHRVNGWALLANPLRYVTRWLARPAIQERSFGPADMTASQLPPSSL